MRDGSERVILAGGVRGRHNRAPVECIGRVESSLHCLRQSVSIPCVYSGRTTYDIVTCVNTIFHPALLTYEELPLYASLTAK